MSKEINKVFIINHTHWDREWYLDFDTYRSKLKYGIIDLVDKLEKGIIKNFFFDGQTVILEDSKEVLDEVTYNKFISYINQGIIELGPWYILPDEFISDEESIIENIRVGSKIAKANNSKTNFGYFPDAFGHIGQVPTILNKFGIEHVLIHRGTKNVDFLSKWQSSNGRDIVNAIILNLREGYYQTIFHTPINRFEEEYEKFFNRAIQNVGNEKSLLIMNGCDHTFPPSDFNTKLDLLRNKYRDIEFEEVTLSQYLERIKNEDFSSTVISGEQRDPEKAFVLPSVASTRSYLKADNRKLIDKLTLVAEPFEILTGVNKSNEKQIEHNFKNALKNQPHDSILGCSIDEVVLDMETRTRNSNSSIDSMIKYKLDSLAEEEYSDFEQKYNEYISVLNNNISNEPKVQRIIVKVPKTLDRGNIRLEYFDTKIIEGIDNVGHPLNHSLIDRWEDEVLLAAVNNAPSYQQYVFYEVEYIQAPSKEIKFDWIRVNLIEEQIREKTFIDFDVYENSDVKIYANEGGAYIEYNERKINIAKFAATMDAGDSYNFSPINNELYYSKIISSKKLEETNLFKFEFVVEHKIPKSLANDRNSVSNDIVNNEYKILLTYKNYNSHKPSFDVKIEAKNYSSDIKIMQDFETDIKSVLADQAFEYVERHNVNNPNWEAPGENNSEIIYPQFNSIRNVFSKELGIQFSHVGLNEWELIENKLKVTLLRNVGWLSRRDMKSRKGGAGPSYEIPNAQGIGKHTFEYSFRMGVDKIDLNKSIVNVETPYHQGNRFVDSKIIDLDGYKDLLITRIKNVTIDDKNYIELRLVNPTFESIVIDTREKVFINDLNLVNKEINDYNNIEVKSKDFITVMIDRG